MSRWWCDLGCLEGKDSNRVGWLSAAVTKKLGRGNSIIFWKEKWTGMAPLATSFLRLYNISTTKEAKVSDMGEWREGIWCWNFAWRRRLFTWEEELVEAMLHELAGIQLVAEENDAWC